MKKRTFKAIALLLGSLLFSGCMIQMQNPTVKNYRKVLAMENLTPVTVEQLRQLVANDTTHYKVVVLTSSCCGPCELAMRDVYPKKMAECDSSQVRWYFVETDYSSAQYMDEVFRTYHLDSPRYWINDTLPQYRPLMMKNMWTVVWNLIFHYDESFEELGLVEADNRLDNIVNGIAPQRQLITGPNGTPTTVILDPQGHMKCTYTIYNDSTALLEPTDIRHIAVPVTDLDYTKVDTLSYAPKVCTPEGCKEIEETPFTSGQGVIVPPEGLVMSPEERAVAAMPDSLFDGRPHIVFNEGMYQLSARQIELLQSFDNPYAPKMISLIESIDSLMHSVGDTITTRDTLLQYYRLTGALEGMTARLTEAEMNQLSKLMEE